MATTFTIDGETYPLVVSRFTFAEAKAFEAYTGYAFQALESPEIRNKAEVMQGLLWLSMKRQQPTLKYDDLDDVAIDEIEWAEDVAAAEVAEVDPTGDPTESAPAATLNTGG